MSKMAPIVFISLYFIPFVTEHFISHDTCLLRKVVHFNTLENGWYFSIKRLFHFFIPVLQLVSFYFLNEFQTKLYNLIF